MNTGKSILVDTSKCTACRGCQIACKQWNGLPATKTKQVGTYQNPQDLSAQTWKLVRFAEGRKEDKKPYWYFFADSCRHCVEPPCKMAAESTLKGAVLQDEKTGAVLFTEATKKLKLKEIQESCPYNIPRADPKTKRMFKCTMCVDRQTGDMPPACVQTCPTAMTYGDRHKILDLAAKRVEELKKTFPKARAIDADSVRVIFIVTDDPAKYHKHAAS